MYIHRRRGFLLNNSSWLSYQLLSWAVSIQSILPIISVNSIFCILQYKRLMGQKSDASYCWLSLYLFWHQNRLANSRITKARLFKYIENFISKYWKISDKNSDIFHISTRNIDCGYPSEPPWQGGSNEYPQSMFLSSNKKNNIYPYVLPYKIGVYKGQNYIGMFLWWYTIWAGVQRFSQFYMCAQRRLITVCASMHSHQSSLAIWSLSLAIPRSHSEYSNQTARMRRLICVLAGRTCNLVGNALPWHI